MQFYVVCKIKPGTPRKKVIGLIRAEAKAAWKLYEAGLLREVHYIDDMSGAVMTFEAKDLAEVKTACDTLPMINQGVLEPEYIPLKPYTGFGKLFAK